MYGLKPAPFKRTRFSPSPAAQARFSTGLDADENSFPCNSYGIHCNSFLRVFGSPRRGIERPGMPGANQLAAFDHPLGERASPVRAFIVQRPNYPVDIGNTQCSRASAVFPGLSGMRQLALSAN